MSLFLVNNMLIMHLEPWSVHSISFSSSHMEHNNEYTLTFLLAFLWKLSECVFVSCLHAPQASFVNPVSISTVYTTNLFLQ